VLTERKSHYLLAARQPDKTAAATTAALNSLSRDLIESLIDRRHPDGIDHEFKVILHQFIRGADALSYLLGHRHVAAGVRKMIDHKPQATTRKPPPKPIPRRPSSPPPRLGGNVAFRDNQVPQNGKPQDVGTKNRTVFELAAIEPVKAACQCRKEISATNSGFRDDLRLHIADAYAVAVGLENDPQALAEFLANDFWKESKRKPKIDEQTGPLLLVMRFVFNGLVGNRYKRASKYAAGLKQYWVDEVPAREVAAKIKEDGGIEALCKAPTANKPKKKQKPERSSKLTFSASEARTEGLLALSEGQAAHLVIRRLTGERGVVATIVRLYPVKT
jgi:hypothetical protein